MWEALALSGLALWGSVAEPTPQDERGLRRPVGVTSAQELVDALDLERFVRHVRVLSSQAPPILGTRWWSTPGNAAARDYVEAELASYGYAVERHAYEHEGVAMDQVYATKIGIDPSAMVLVSAHLDSQNFDTPPETFAPGANDDASGVALVLEAARVFAPASVETDVSIRFVLWNNEETALAGSEAYVADRYALQGIEDPPGSGLFPEPCWLGIVQHDMLLWDHGDGFVPPEPPWPPQAKDADIDIEYRAISAHGPAALELARHFRGANAAFASAYPAQIGERMCCTDSVVFQELVPAISVRENRRSDEIGTGSDPHWHRDSDVFETYAPEDFLLGFDALRTTTGGVATLVRARTR